MPTDPRNLPPALLADATWYGTLAAVRDLGARGVPVTLGCDALVAPARWSRYARRTVACPPTGDADRFLEWLLAFGAHQPGHVLYPTSDDMAFLVAAHVDALAGPYHLFTPTLEALFRLLDKSQLVGAARAAGLECPETWLPETEAEVARLAREVPFPVLVKPRVQVLAAKVAKVARVDRREDLVARWRERRALMKYHGEILRRLPHAELPMIQVQHATSERIYTVDGFADHSGTVLGLLGCHKMLQRPRRSGPGLVFEGAPVEPSIGEGLDRLCRQTGFRGVFDAEFAIDGDRRLLIDFNPRFYNHMAFEVDRGLPLPWLAYLAALGEREALDQAIQVGRPGATLGPRAYVHGLPTRLMLAVQGATGGMSAGERAHWRRWLDDNAGRLTDPASAPGDRVPALVDWIMHGLSLARHPRAFYRQLAGPEAPAPRTG